jgi:hypothetical protein
MSSKLNGYSSDIGLVIDKGFNNFAFAKAL